MSPTARPAPDPTLTPARRHRVRLASPVRPSFLTAKIGGLADFDPPAEIVTEFTAHTPPTTGPGSNWQIGAIIGASGDGKSTVARAAFGDDFIESLTWPDDAAIVDAFPAGLTAEQITAALAASGLSSVPAWFQPHRTLSVGQRFRAHLARCLLMDRDVVAVDEFGSTVDDQVAAAAATAVGRGVRSGRFRARRFVAVGARGDFCQHLQPDWVLNMATRTLARGWVQPERDAHPRLFEPAPRRRFELVRLNAARALWPAFARHHYLTGRLHPGARGYAALALPDRRPVGFLATLQTPGQARARLVHRLVVLPDWQGVGLGSRLLDAVAALESQTHRLGIRTSHPALIALLKRGGRSGRWYGAAVAPRGSRQTGFDRTRATPTANSHGRPVVTFRYRRD